MEVEDVTGIGLSTGWTAQEEGHLTVSHGLEAAGRRRRVALIVNISVIAYIVLAGLHPLHQSGQLLRVPTSTSSRQTLRLR